MGKVKCVSSHSEFVRKVTGVDNVCERAAILAAGEDGRSDAEAVHESDDNSSGRKEGKDQNMKRILIFSGTTEGRRITEFLDGRNVKVYVSAATEYGKECTGEHENAEVFFGRMDQKQMTEMIKEKQIDLVIDATHPFAQLVTGEIRRACEISGVQYLRCLREKMEAVPG